MSLKCRLLLSQGQRSLSGRDELSAWRMDKMLTDQFRGQNIPEEGENVNKGLN